MPLVVKAGVSQNRYCAVTNFFTNLETTGSFTTAVTLLMICVMVFFVGFEGFVALEIRLRSAGF